MLEEVFRPVFALGLGGRIFAMRHAGAGRGLDALGNELVAL